MDRLRGKFIDREFNVKNDLWLYINIYIYSVSRPWTTPGSINKYQIHHVITNLVKYSEK